jgi:hypothetical protein
MSLFSKLIFAALLSPVFVHAQINDEPSPTTDRGESTTSTAGVKFRGFKSAQEDLPLMNENWKLSFFQLAATEPARFDDKKSTAFFFYNYFSFNYKIDDSSRFAVRPVFTLESPGVNKYNDTVSKWNMNWGDWYVQYSKFDLFELGPFGSRTNLRLYAPTSDASKNNGMIAQFHPELFFETSLRRGTGIEIAFKGDYYAHSKKAYSFTTESGKVVYTTNKEAELESYAELNQRLTSKFNLKPRLTWFDEWKHSSPVNNFSSSHTTRFAVGLGLDWHPSNNFNTTVIYSNETTYYANRSFIRKDKNFNPNNNELVALTNYRF